MTNPRDNGGVILDDSESMIVEIIEYLKLVGVPPDALGWTDAQWALASIHAAQGNDPPVFATGRVSRGKR